MCIMLLLCPVLSRCGIDEATAARLAREIERGDTSNPHLAEERGQEVDDSGVREWHTMSAWVDSQPAKQFKVMLCYVRML